MFRTVTVLGTVLACVIASAPSSADARADEHAPIGVMADHYHKAGEVMFSYRYMHMHMEGNRDGTSDRSPAEIAANEPSRFGPPLLRVVPTEMTMDMHMFGVMWAPSDRVTLMGMVNYIDKEMEHVTFMGMMGTNRLGTFTTKTSGLGDTRLSALVRISEDDTSRWHAILGVSLPTGDIEETDQILTPMNTRPSPRLPYPMQLGSGTYDLIAGLTYAQNGPRWGWGSQWESVFRIGENDEDYTLGDTHMVQGWLSYLVQEHLSLSARLSYKTRDNIDGQDPLIAAPVQTADPDRQAFDRIDLSVGTNVVVGHSGHRLALEVTTPLYQDFDGPQLETDWQITVGWQLAI